MNKEFLSSTLIAVTACVLGMYKLNRSLTKGGHWCPRKNHGMGQFIIYFVIKKEKNLKYHISL